MKNTDIEILKDLAQRNTPNLESEILAWGIILLSSPDRLETFLQQNPQFKVYKRTKENSWLVDTSTRTLWYSMVPSLNNLHGRRFYKLIIDATLDPDEELLESIYISSTYLTQIKIFDII